MGLLELSLDLRPVEFVDEKADRIGDELLFGFGNSHQHAEGASPDRRAELAAALVPTRLAPVGLPGVLRELDDVGDVDADALVLHALEGIVLLRVRVELI